MPATRSKRSLIRSSFVSDQATRRTLAVAVSVTLAGMLASAPVAIIGCAAKSQPTTGTGAGLDASSPLVISGTPSADTAAFNTASRSLLQARHGVIEEVAPKPKWRSFRNDRDKTLAGAADEGDAEQGIAPRSSTAIGSDHDSPSREDGDYDSRGAQAYPGVPSTRGIVPFAPEPFDLETPDEPLRGPLAPQYLSDQLAPSTRALDIEDLPVTRQPLPDGRVRLIWHMRSFGGPRVTTAAAAAVPNGGLQRRGVTLTPADLAPLLAVIQGHLGDKGQVLPLGNESKLVITCNADAESGVLALLDDLDVPLPQVEITAKIFEVSHDFDYQQGARILMNRIVADGSQQALSSFQTQKLLDSITNAVPFQGSVISLMQTFAEAGISLDAQFELLAEAGLIHVVSSPRLTVAEGQTGYMLAGQELPIQSVNIVNNVLQTATTYKPVGVQLYITPQAIGDGLVKLHTVSIVSSVAGFSPLPAIRGGAQQQQDGLLMNPIIDSREAETAVTVPEGETLVISGMRMVRTTTREDKIPGLGDIPLLGNLFKSHRSQQRLTDLYFFVTPTLASAAE